MEKARRVGQKVRVTAKAAEKAGPPAKASEGKPEAEKAGVSKFFRETPHFGRFTENYRLNPVGIGKNADKSINLIYLYYLARTAFDVILRK